VFSVLSAAEKIRKKQRLKVILAEIVENLKDYFDELQVRKFGRKSRFIVLTDIAQVHKIGSKGLNLVIADFNSELGTMRLSIAIKRFSSTNEALKNKLLTERLSQRLDGTGVSTPRVVFENGPMLIYEGIQGDTFYDSTLLDQNSKLKLAGEALAKYHTVVLRKVDPERYFFLLQQTLKTLALPLEEKSNLISIAEKHLSIISSYSSGTAIFGDFHQGNILFSSENGKIKTWLIDPEYVEEERTADRMEDTATFFLRTAIDHFETRNSLTGFRKKILPFFEGYAAYLNQSNLSLNKIYQAQVEAAFAFHLGLCSLLESLFVKQLGDMNNKSIIDRFNSCLSLAKHCWTTGLD
jgi:hypothetical protein